MNRMNEKHILGKMEMRGRLINPPYPAHYPNEAIKILFETHTIRRFLDKPIEQEKLDIIVDAGLCAPNAGGCGAPIFLVSQNKEVNLELGRISKSFAHEKFPTTSKSQPSTAGDSNITNAFYDAPVVISVFTPKDWPYGSFDASMAASNMILAASSLGIGSCFVSRAEKTFATPVGIYVMKQALIPAGYEAQLHVVMGYPKSVKHDSKKTYPTRVSWI